MNPNLKEYKQSVFTDDMILKVEILKTASKNDQNLMNSVNLQDTKSMYKNTTDFCILTVNYHKEKLRKVLLTNRINKNTTSRNKPN